LILAIRAERNRASACRASRVCLRKLHLVIEFDPAAREHELACLLRERSIHDEAAWSERRARWIRDGTRAEPSQLRRSGE
jgi:hypothetical protein